MTGPIEVADRVEEIPVNNGTVSAQRDACFAYSYLIFPVLNGSHFRTIDVLLYRRGYELIEIPARPWWSASGSGVAEKVAWKEAHDLLTQKAAVDRIAFRFGRQPYDKDVLRFAAREYACLADSPMAASPEASTTRDELRRLARECSHHAGEKAP
jgi:hypothetical protein